jgi:DnaJ-class molecular chaperone
MTDLYNILQIKPNASEREIKKAYYNLSKKYHPDKNSDADSCRKFQEINSAYNILIDDKTRKNYIQLNQNQKSQFQTMLESIFAKKFNLSELKNFGVSFSKDDWGYLETNYMNIINSLNFKELFELLTKGIIPRKKEMNSFLCSESDVNYWDDTQADYYYDLPIYFQVTNKIDIKLVLDITLNVLIEETKKKIKIKRRLEDNDLSTTYLFKIDKPFIIFYGGGDMQDGDYGNLIIQLQLPKNFYWKENFIIYEYTITLYQMVYGLDIELDLGGDLKIEYKNYVPSRDGFLINVDKLNIKNHLFAIKLVMVYEHTDEKEEILKSVFN